MIKFVWTADFRQEFMSSMLRNDFQWMNAGDGAQYLPGGEAERVTT